MYQIDTTNILFICGGAFDGLERIIENRLGANSIGFNAEVHEKVGDNVDVMLKKCMPQDLVKYGLIPEFVGRLPVSVSLNYLDKDALVRILTEPKNALIKQYQKLFEIDGIELEFDRDALEVIAEKSVERKTGARGLRAILEHTMTNMMYELPSDDTVGRCRVTRAMVEEEDGEPELTYRTEEVQVKKKFA